jgi:hypothetical protein
MAGDGVKANACYVLPVLINLMLERHFVLVAQREPSRVRDRNGVLNVPVAQFLPAAHRLATLVRLVPTSHTLSALIVRLVHTILIQAARRFMHALPVLPEHSATVGRVIAPRVLLGRTIQVLVARPRGIAFRVLVGHITRIEEAHHLLLASHVQLELSAPVVPRPNFARRATPGHTIQSLRHHLVVRVLLELTVQK